MAPPDRKLSWVKPVMRGAWLTVGSSDIGESECSIVLGLSIGIGEAEEIFFARLLYSADYGIIGQYRTHLMYHSHIDTSCRL